MLNFELILSRASALISLLDVPAFPGLKIQNLKFNIQNCFSRLCVEKHAF